MAGLTLRSGTGRVQIGRLGPPRVEVTLPQEVLTVQTGVTVQVLRRRPREEEGPGPALVPEAQKSHARFGRETLPSPAQAPLARVPPVMDVLAVPPSRSPPPQITVAVARRGRELEGPTPPAVGLIPRELDTKKTPCPPLGPVTALDARALRMQTRKVPILAPEWPFSAFVVQTGRPTPASPAPSRGPRLESAAVVRPVGAPPAPFGRFLHVTVSQGYGGVVFLRHVDDKGSPGQIRVRVHVLEAAVVLRPVGVCRRWPPPYLAFVLIGRGAQIGCLTRVPRDSGG